MDIRIVNACRVAAKKYDVPLPTLIGIIRQESAGKFFAMIQHAQDFGGETFEEPLTRYEGHYFYKRTAGAKRQRAIKEGLAAPRWGVIKNPRSQQRRWTKLIEPAMRITTPGAIESCSWSGPQVMGAHWKKLGFNSAMDMLDYLREGGYNAGVDIMMRYIKEFGLLDEVRRGDIEGFVRGYNGTGQVAKYSKSIRRFIAQALAKYGTETDVQNLVSGVPATDAGRARRGRTMLRMGIYNDSRVREAQALLIRHGYVVGSGGPDGDFGPTTKKAVMDFQRDNGLDVDGLIGPETWRLLNSKRLDPNERPGIPGPAEAMVQTPEGRQGAAVAAASATGNITMNSTKDQVQMVADQLLPATTGTGGAIDTIYTILTITIAFITIAGIGWALWGWVKAKRVDKSALDETIYEPELERADAGEAL